MKAKSINRTQKQCTFYGVRIFIRKGHFAIYEKQAETIENAIFNSKPLQEYINKNDVDIFIDMNHHKELSGLKSGYRYAECFICKLFPESELKPESTKFIDKLITFFKKKKNTEPYENIHITTLGQDITRAVEFLKHRIESIKTNEDLYRKINSNISSL